METKEIIDLIINTLKNSRKKSDNPFISIDALVDYLVTLKKHTSEKSVYDHLEHEKELVTLQNNSQADIEMFRSVIDSGKDALRAIIIVNGGAIVSLLALLANLEEQLLIKLSKGLTSALALFSLGVFLATVIYGLRYLSQHFFSQDQLNAGYFFQGTSVYLGVMTYVTFAWGLYLTFEAFQKL